MPQYLYQYKKLKYLLLLLSTGIIIASILIYTFSVDSNTVKIGVLELKSQPVQNEVICSGKVEEVDFELEINM